jgi:hypothetical protein
MNGSFFPLQLGIAVALVLLVAASTIRFVVKAKRAGAEPIIRATFRELQKGWYQVHVAVANQAPYGVVVDELRRVRPRSARLMAPIQSVSTRKGDFQVWSYPTTDKATTSIPLDLTLGPHEARAGTVSRDSEGHVTAWLFLPEDSDPVDLTLELTFLYGEEHLRRYRVTATRERKRDASPQRGFSATMR